MALAVRSRLELPVIESRYYSWMCTGAVTLLAFVLRVVGLSSPNKQIFDEIYYAKDAHDLLRYGVERDANGPSFVAHPPLGKWAIAMGEQVLGYNTVGWRIASVFAGTLTVLVLIRVAHRLFGSTLLGCVAGLLLALDGLHFVVSRAAVLDVFIALFLLIAFACLLLDRDARRAALADGRRPWSWWRPLIGVFLGLSLSIKWSALWFIPAFVLLAFIWDVGATRTAGAKRPLRESLPGGAVLALVVGGGAVVVYLMTWTGWFVTDDGWGRQWAAQTNSGIPFVPDALVSFWRYQRLVYEFHSTLSTPHPYQSTPWSWLFAGRPVTFFYEEGAGSCGASECRREVLALGTPLLWWSFLPALVMTAWHWLARRDWRAGAFLLCFFVGWAPWLLYPERTMFFFYMLPALPFLVLMVTYCLGVILGSPSDTQERRAIGATVVAVFVGLVALNFLFFYPIYTGASLTPGQWDERMWFDSWI